MSRKTRKNVGIIGLGIIGTRVAALLRANGFHTYVWSRSPHPVPNFLSSPAELAEVCDTIQIFVSDPAALTEVIRAMDGKLEKRHTIICSATVGLDATREAAKSVESHGAQFLDAPFTGSKNAAASGKLVYFIGGSDAALKKAKPLLTVSGKQIVKIGAIGDASVVKVVTNLIAAANVQILAEALAIVKSAGLDPAIMTRVMEHHGTRSALIDQKLGVILKGDLEPHFTLKNMLKDLNLGLRLGAKSDLRLPAANATTVAFQDSVDKGWAELDYAAIVKAYGLGEKPIQPEPPEPVTPEPENGELKAEEISDEKNQENKITDSQKAEPDSALEADKEPKENPAKSLSNLGIFVRRVFRVRQTPNPDLISESANSEPSEELQKELKSEPEKFAPPETKIKDEKPSVPEPKIENEKNLPIAAEPQPEGAAEPPTLPKAEPEEEKPYQSIFAKNKESKPASVPENLANREDKNASQLSNSELKSEPEKPFSTEIKTEEEKPYIPIFAKNKPPKKDAPKIAFSLEKPANHEDDKSKQLPEEPKPAGSLTASVTGVPPKRPVIKVNVPDASIRQTSPQRSDGFFKKLFGKKTTPEKSEKLPDKPVKKPIEKPADKPDDKPVEKSPDQPANNPPKDKKNDKDQADKIDKK